MAARSLNKAQLIGNLTRDPELRYTPSGTAVCSFGLATNRSWTTDSGERKESAEFHRLVAWNKLAELCSQLLKKGRKVFVEGRLQTRSWTGQDGNQRTTTEIVINEMIILDSRRDFEARGGVVDDYSQPAAKPSDQTTDDSQADDSTADEDVKDESKEEPVEEKPAKKGKKAEKTEEVKKPEVEKKEDVNPDDIPF